MLISMVNSTSHASQTARLKHREFRQ